MWQERIKPLTFITLFHFPLIDLMHANGWLSESMTKWNGHDAMMQMKTYWKHEYVDQDYRVKPLTLCFTGCMQMKRDMTKWDNHMNEDRKRKSNQTR